MKLIFYKRAPVLGAFFVGFLFCIGWLHAQEAIATRALRFYGLSAYRYALTVDGKRVGSISSIKMPFFDWYILYDFFVEESHRGRGFGKKLLAYAVALKKSEGATKIFVQPGPFERKGRKCIAVTGPERGHKIQQLLKLYTAHGFVLLTGWRARMVSKILAVMYKIASIDEDPTLLMVHTK